MKAKGGARPQPAPVAAQQPPISPTAKGAKYRNRDGSKFITLPDTSSAPSSTQPSPTSGVAPSAKPSAPTVAANALAASDGPATIVNRKKQKRREKERAKAAAAAALNGASDSSLPGSHAQAHDADPTEESDEADQFDSESRQTHFQTNGHTSESAQKAKKSKKKKKKGGAAAGADDDDAQPISSSTSRPTVSHGSGISRERIWNTSSQEERERIKEFWLGLGEDDRKSLVKVEKDAVLKKMKEQQKHTCSCSVCGRKRTAIEEELEGLYDAYYEELEQFANHPQQDGHPPMMGSSRHFGFPPTGRFPSYAGHQPSRGRIVEHVGDDDEEEELDEPYSDEEIDDEAYSDEEPEEEVPRDYAADFFNFGSSLTVQGGILTVADDLLKNDGKKFIEMMEQLAERRMAREVDSAQDSYVRNYGHGVNGGLPGHDHPAPPPVDEEEYEDDDDEDYDSQEDDEYEEDDDDTMTEEQRMEEGRRMFQIFAARMFEQRVLQAYREKVARERQAKLMEEEEEELRKEEARKEKKAKEAQKKKEKAAQKKAAAAEEKARKEAERAAEEAARRQAEAEKAEEARRKAEEKRKKREAQKKEEEEERTRKEAERQRQRQLHVEQERKAKEAKEREKKAREERLQKEKEAREQKEREAKELKERQEASKRQKEKDLESKAAKIDSKASQKQKQQEERAAKKAAALATPVTMTLPKRPAPPATNPALPVLPQQHPTTAATSASPRPSIAAPALPKAPTPVRPRQTSAQDSLPTAVPGTSLLSENAGLLSHSPVRHTPAPNSPGMSGPPSHRGSVTSHHSTNASHAISPLQPNMARFPPNNHPPAVNMPPTAMSFPPGLHAGPPGFGSPMFAPVTGFRPPPGMAPPGLSSPLLNRGFPAPVPPPGFHQAMADPIGAFGVHGVKDAGPISHSRQPSGGFESPMMHSAQPISRPTPIGRPASIVQGQRPSSDSPSGNAPKAGGDDLESHLGSSALLDDSEDVVPTLPGFVSGQRRSYAAPGRSQAFPAVPFGDPGILSQSQPLWSSSPIQPSVMNPFGQSPAPPPGLAGPGGWPIASPIPGFSAPIGIGRQPGPAKPPASVVRQTLCQVCRDFYVQAPTEDGFVAVNLVQDTLKDRIEHNPLGNGPITEKDILALCETEGTMINGGGNFDVRDEANGTKSIRWNQDKMPQQMYGGGFGAPGQLTSPGSSFSR